MWDHFKADFPKQQNIEADMGNLTKFWREISTIIPTTKSARNKIWPKDATNKVTIPTNQHPIEKLILFTNIGPYSHQNKEKYLLSYNGYEHFNVFTYDDYFIIE